MPTDLAHVFSPFDHPGNHVRSKKISMETAWEMCHDCCVMKTSILSAVCVSLLSFAAFQVPAVAKEGNGPWLTNYEQALKTASAEKLPILVNFTGSDWCGWCIRLDKETFSQPAFLNFAKKNAVLLKVDFPRKTQLPAQEAAENRDLATRFGVEGFPTLVLLDGSGKELDRNVGYLPGGPEAMEAWIKKHSR